MELDVLLLSNSFGHMQLIAVDILSVEYHDRQILYSEVFRDPLNDFIRYLPIKVGG